MSNITESYTTVQNEDGSYTTTEISTYVPPTPKQQAIATVGALAIIFAPLGFIGVAAYLENRVEKKRLKAAEAEAQKNKN